MCSSQDSNNQRSSEMSMTFGNPAPTSATAEAASPTDAPPPTTASIIMEANVWFLGGNDIIKLLTSVEGDFDPSVLSGLSSVPIDIGELSLSVESLVSDDATTTIGDFDNALLARIAENTLKGKKAAAMLNPSAFTSTNNSNNRNSNTVLLIASNKELELQKQPFTATLVPNPLAGIQSVPNPLAKVTPPGSPTSTPVKRKALHFDPLSTSGGLPKRKMLKVI